MNKFKTKPFQGKFQDPLDGEKRVSECIARITTKENLTSILDYLTNHRDFSALGVDYALLVSKLTPMLKNLIDDLEDCKSYVQISSVPPTGLKKDLNSLKSHFESIQRILDTNPILSFMIDSIIGEGMFEKNQNFYLLNSQEVQQ